MESKTFYLGVVSAGISEAYERLRVKHPRERLPLRSRFPSVLVVTVGEVVRTHGLEADVTLQLACEDGATTEHIGRAYSNGYGNDCLFLSERDAWTQLFLSLFAIELFFNVLAKANIDMDGWMHLPD